MISSCAAINRFYRSAVWQKARLMKITNTYGRCEKCGGVGEEVHHIIPLKPSNIGNINITLNQNNLILLCKYCHNREHNRFKENGQKFDADGNMHLQK